MAAHSAPPLPSPSSSSSSKLPHSLFMKERHHQLQQHHHHLAMIGEGPPVPSASSPSSSGGGASSSRQHNLPCVCSVCGDGASEHLHYGAICCFSCRAFFRRYADRQGCVCVRGDGNCVVDVSRRNDCMHCRLKKCLQIGMKKDYVRGPNQSLRKKRAEQGYKGKKRKYEEGREGGGKREKSSSSSPTAHHRPSSPPSPPSPSAPSSSSASLWAQKRNRAPAPPPPPPANSKGHHNFPFLPASPGYFGSGLVGASNSRLFPALQDHSDHHPPPPPPIFPDRHHHQAHPHHQQHQMHHHPVDAERPSGAGAGMDFHQARPVVRRAEGEDDDVFSHSVQQPRGGGGIVHFQRFGDMDREEEEMEALNRRIGDDILRRATIVAAAAAAAGGDGDGNRFEELPPTPSMHQQHHEQQQQQQHRQQQQSGHSGGEMAVDSEGRREMMELERKLLAIKRSRCEDEDEDESDEVEGDGEDLDRPEVGDVRQDHQRQFPPPAILHAGRVKSPMMYTPHRDTMPSYRYHPAERSPPSAESVVCEPELSLGLVGGDDSVAGGSAVRGRPSPHSCFSSPGPSASVTGAPSPSAVSTPGGGNKQAFGVSFLSMSRPMSTKGSKCGSGSGSNSSGSDRSSSGSAAAAAAGMDQASEEEELAATARMRKRSWREEEEFAYLTGNFGAGGNSRRGSASSSESFWRGSSSSSNRGRSSRLAAAMAAAALGVEEEGGAPSPSSEVAASRMMLSCDRLMPTVTFTQEEFKFVDFIRTVRNTIVGKINDAYYNAEHRNELTAILMSKGRIKPSFRFMERLNKSIMCTSLELVKEVLSMFTLSENTQQVLTSENVSYASLVGAAVYTHGNSATTFVEQARLTGMTTKYLNYLEENGLADVVPRMEAHYLNPSPWAEKEVYEDEFNQILKEIGRHVGTDQILTCLLILANLFSLPDATARDLLDEHERASLSKTRQQVALLLNRYLRVKFGPKKASSKTHHHFYLMSALKKVGKIYMEKKLKLMQADRISDIQISSAGEGNSHQGHHHQQHHQHPHQQYHQ